MRPVVIAALKQQKCKSYDDCQRPGLGWASIQASGGCAFSIDGDVDEEIELFIADTLKAEGH